MRSTVWTRFLAYCVPGCVLLIIYEVVFMARTSANRNWNHLHDTKLSPMRVERLVLRNFNESKVEQVRDNSTKLELQLPFVANNDPYNLPGFSVSSVKYGGKPLILSDLSAIFSFHGEGSTGSTHSMRIPQAQVTSIYYSHGLNLVTAIDSAIENGFRAIVLVVPADWMPNHGRTEFEVPVLAVLTPPTVFEGEVEIGFAATNLDAVLYEYKLSGVLPDTIIVGDSRGTPQTTAVMAGMADAFYNLVVSKGWHPLRSVQFVSFPHFSAATWAKHHEGWLNRRAIAYIDVGGPLKGSVSPLLNHTASYAAQQLLEAGLISEYEFSPQLVSCPLGANSLEFDYQVPSMSVSFENPVNTVRLLNIILASLLQEPFFPFKVEDYSKYMGVYENEFRMQAVKFDNATYQSWLAFTQEYPWYQGFTKLRSLGQRKLANLHIRQIERCFQGPEKKHILFSSDASWTSTEVSTEHLDLVQKCLRKVFS